LLKGRYAKEVRVPAMGGKSVRKKNKNRLIKQERKWDGRRENSERGKTRLPKAFK